MISIVLAGMVLQSRYVVVVPSVINADVPLFQKTIDSSLVAYRAPEPEMTWGRVSVLPSLKVSSTFVSF